MQMSACEQLRPYIMEQARAASEKGSPPMCPLFFDFPRDEGSYKVEDQFVFGPDFLVAPVLYKGGQTLTANAPLKRLPLYLRGEKVLPIKAYQE